MGIQDQIPNCFFNHDCENSIHQRDLFESAFSSVVSSPVNSHPGIPIPAVASGGGVLIGSICNSSEISPQSRIHSASYNTPLNSPPKLNLSITDHQIQGNYQLPFPTDSGFEAKISTFGGNNDSGNKSFTTAGSQFNRISAQDNKLGDSKEEPTVSETGMKGQSGISNGRKRKVIPKETQSSCIAKDDKVVTEAEKEAKRSKSTEKSTKDYIHVRARRGQATDSHSLAERVRREKISKRMKFLQDLVPGCNKVMGKAVMLDEIINYVQSLQQQVEFLSMKLATVNPRMEALLSKDMFRPLVPMPNNVNASVQPLPYGSHSQINGIVPDGPENQCSLNPLIMHRNSIVKPPLINGFGEASTFWENDLQSVVNMATGQDQPQGFHGQMKIEL